LFDYPAAMIAVLGRAKLAVCVNSEDCSRLKEIGSSSAAMSFNFLMMDPGIQQASL
jgi:hypothetical protein